MGLTCKICFESASSPGPQGAKARVTLCGHVFCQPCAAIWFDKDTACPVCRASVSGLSSLISLYDQDAGVQQLSSLSISDEGSESGPDGHGADSQSNDHGSSKVSQRGEKLKELKPGNDRSFGSTEDEEVQVKYVLGKVAGRWQQVMFERAKLKVQVARLEKLRQEMQAQIQSLSDENRKLKQATSYVSFDGDVDKSSLSPISKGCYEEFPSNYLEPTSWKLKVEERLTASKWELGQSFSMHSGPVHGIAVNLSGNLVATASWDHLCRVYDVYSEEEVAVLSGHLLGLYAVKFSPAKRDLVGTVSSDHTCRLWNANSGDCIRILEGHKDEVNGLSFKPGTHLLATASDDNTCMIWDAERGISVATLKGHRHVVYGVCFQPHGHLLATASFDYTAKLWDPRSEKDVQTLHGHLEDVIGVDIDDSGLFVATGSDDKSCRIWDLRMGSPLAVLQEHCGEVKRVVFSPHGKLLATTSGDTTIRLFDTSSFQCVHVLSSHTDHVFDVAWSPTAEFLVTASHDRMWKLWQPKVLPVRRSVAKDFML